MKSMDDLLSECVQCQGMWHVPDDIMDDIRQLIATLQAQAGVPLDKCPNCGFSVYMCFDSMYPGSFSVGCCGVTICTRSEEETADLWNLRARTVNLDKDANHG